MPDLLVQIQFAVAALRLVSADRIQTEASDAEWVSEARLGERRAQGLLYRRHAPALLRRATRLLARTGEAEDAVQDTFIEAFRDLDTLQDTSRFAHWLMRILLHQAHRRFRRRRLLRKFGLDGSDDASLEHLADPQAGPEARVHLAQIDAALRTLDGPARIAWVLRFVEGCSLVEVAECEECSLATIKRRIGAANDRVREYVTFELPEI
jgi:RNA polymerase sigma-70 factor (ECF subfamily)